MDDETTIEVSKEFMSFWSRISPKFRENKTTELIAIGAWTGGFKQGWKEATEEETPGV